MASPRPPSPAVSTTPTQPPGRNFFQCGTCAQSYTRIDHLARHVRSHTQERPYRCTVCDKRFGRIDLLSRHTSLHNPHSERALKKRRRNAANAMRVGQACNACAENHLRCDDEKPCRRCQRKSISCQVPERSIHIVTTPPPSCDPNPLEPPVPTVRTVQPANIELQAPPEQFENVISPPPGDSITAQRWPADQPPFLEAAPQGTPPVIPSPARHEIPPFVPIESADVFPGPMASGFFSGTRTPNGLISFGFETDLDLSAIDLDFLESYNTRIPFEFEQFHLTQSPSNVPDTVHEPGRNDGKDARSIQRLRWRFIPAPQDHGYCEHDNLLLPPSEPGSNPSPQSLVVLEDRGFRESLDVSSRDKILGIFLSQMKHPALSPLASFPSVELLDSLVKYFLTARSSGASAWIHCASFNPRKTTPELLLAMAAAGAVLTPDPSLRKLGYAMQEVIRLHLPTIFEANNTRIRETELQQAYLLHLEVGLWSGNSRKIEISEGFRQPLITMLRRGGMFHSSAYPPIIVRADDDDDDDTGQILEERWSAWVKAESFKRLVYHLFEHDAQSSMALLSPPLISYAELSLPLPSSAALWTARTAHEWKSLYTAQFAPSPSPSPSIPVPIPTLAECVANLDHLESTRRVTDMPLACSAVLQVMWGMVWEYRQLSALLSNPSRYWDNGLLMTSRYQELSKMLTCFGIGYKGESPLHYHFILMHMHMSLEEIQLFATSEDPNRACNVPRAIAGWARTKESRQAAWHAGQVIRELKRLPVQSLRGFMAVALYHASLGLWAYGMADNLQQQQLGGGGDGGGGGKGEGPVVRLDGGEDEEVQRYIALDRGGPVLKGLEEEEEKEEDEERGMVSVRDPRAVLEMVLRLMQQNHQDISGQMPPLVANLGYLIGKLRDVIK